MLRTTFGEHSSVMVSNGSTPSVLVESIVVLRSYLKYRAIQDGILGVQSRLVSSPQRRESYLMSIKVPLNGINIHPRLSHGHITIGA